MDIKSLTNFEWDEAYIVGPYISEDSFNIENGLNANFATGYDESVINWLFFKDKEFICASNIYYNSKYYLNYPYPRKLLKNEKCFFKAGYSISNNQLILTYIK